jgi:DNA primase
MIVDVIRHYHPEWQEPNDTGYEWISTWCPFHQDTNKSASVSFSKNAFHCFACPAKGDVIALIKQQEGVGYAEAFRRAETILEGGYKPLSQRTTRQPRQRLFADQGIGLGVDTAGGEPVQDRIRW